ncbi:hypothetical protein [Streptomyces sp. NPDC006739]|uniref:hypothetical protein n=1 Tax=Streptomyces sp. NPDC006739 TaxID=3364763 RepID=UPI003686128C
MLALRLTRSGRPAVQLRRLLVASASAATAFLLLGALGYALGHPETPGGAVLRLGWCAIPLAATVYFAVAVARTDPGTRPRPGLSAVGLGPARLMAVSAGTTALSCALGSALALLAFLHLRGDITGTPFHGAAAPFLAAGLPLPLPATLTLLAVVPAAAALAVAVTLRPRQPRRTPPDPGRAPGRFGAYGRTATRETFGAYGRFGARLLRTRASGSDSAESPTVPRRDGTATAPDGDTAHETGTGTPDAGWSEALPDPLPSRVALGLPWGVAVLTAGLAVEAYASRSASHLIARPTHTPLPVGAAAVLIGWAVTALGLILAAPGLTHLCGRLLQSVRPGVLRLLAGRVLMAEATRLGRPLGVVCAVASGGYAMSALYRGGAPAFGPLTTLGALQVTGCAVATLFTAAVETRQCRAETNAVLLRLGAPTTMLRAATALRVGALLALFGPLTLVVAGLAALPLSG